MKLASEILKLANGFPDAHKFGLTSQINRSAVSVPSNIAEGSARSNKEFGRFLGIAQGSAYELETQLLLAGELDFISEDNLKDLINRTNEVQKMIHGFKLKVLNTESYV